MPVRMAAWMNRGIALDVDPIRATVCRIAPNASLTLVLTLLSHQHSQSSLESRQLDANYMIAEMSICKS